MNKVTSIALATVFISSPLFAATANDPGANPVTDTVTPAVAPANTSPTKEPPEIIKGKSPGTVGPDDVHPKGIQKKTNKLPPMGSPVGPSTTSAPWPNAPPPQSGLGGTPPPPAPPAQ